MEVERVAVRGEAKDEGRVEEVDLALEGSGVLLAEAAGTPKRIAAHLPKELRGCELEAKMATQTCTVTGAMYWSAFAGSYSYSSSL